MMRKTEQDNHSLTEPKYARNDYDPRIRDNEMDNYNKRKESTRKTPKKTRNRMAPLTNTAMSKVDPSQQLSSRESSSYQVSLSSSIEEYAGDHCLSNLLNEFINKNKFQECYAELKNNTNPVDVGDAFCEYFDGDETLGKENEKDSIDYIKILEGKGVEYSKHALFDDDDVSDITSQIPIGSITSKSDYDAIEEKTRFNREDLSIPLEHWSDINIPRQRTLIPLGNKARVEMTVNTPKQTENGKSSQPPSSSTNLIDRIHSGIPKRSKKVNRNSRRNDSYIPRSSQNKKSNKTDRRRSISSIARLGVTSEKKKVQGDGIVPDRIKSSFSPMKNKSWSRGRSVTPTKSALQEKAKKTRNYEIKSRT
jgi:hypothetical protein